MSLANNDAGSIFNRAVGIQVWAYHWDTGAPDNDHAVLGVHPFTSYATGKFIGLYTGAAGIWLTSSILIPIYDGKFTVRATATGTHTARYIMRLQGIWEATP